MERFLSLALIDRGGVSGYNPNEAPENNPAWGTEGPLPPSDRMKRKRRYPL